MKPILYLVIILFIFSCGETYNPNESFSFKGTDSDFLSARHLIYDLSIDNQMKFQDSSPHRTSYGTIFSERESDGLKIYLSGSPNTSFSVAVHCHKKCKDWQPIFEEYKVSFSKRWAITSGS